MVFFIHCWFCVNKIRARRWPAPKPMAAPTLVLTDAHGNLAFTYCTQGLLRKLSLKGSKRTWYLCICTATCSWASLAWMPRRNDALWYYIRQNNPCHPSIQREFPSKVHTVSYFLQVMRVFHSTDKSVLWQSASYCICALCLVLFWSLCW